MLSHTAFVGTHWLLAPVTSGLVPLLSSSRAALISPQLLNQAFSPNPGVQLELIEQAETGAGGGRSGAGGRVLSSGLK